MLTRDVLRKVRRIEIATRHAAEDMFAGRYRSAFKGQGMEFQKVREYLPGDDVRAIDWNVTARAGAPFVKEFSEERELTLMLLVDASFSLRNGSRAESKRDTAALAAALIAFSAIAALDRVGVVFFSDRVEKYIPPAKGTSHVLRVISEILSFEPESPKTDLNAPLALLGKALRRRVVALWLSDFLGELDEHLLKTTASKHDLIAFRITDPLEKELPKAGLVEMADAETGERMLVDTSSQAVRTAWKKAAAERREALEGCFRRAGIDHVELEAGGDAAKELVRFFRARALRQR